MLNQSVGLDAKFQTPVKATNGFSVDVLLGIPADVLSSHPTVWLLQSAVNSFRKSGVFSRVSFNIC